VAPAAVSTPADRPVLIVVAGAPHCRCIVELFVFLQMGATLDRIDLLKLELEDSSACMATTTADDPMADTMVPMSSSSSPPPPSADAAADADAASGEDRAAADAEAAGGDDGGDSGLGAVGDATFFDGFDAANTYCYDLEQRERLLAIIEARDGVLFGSSARRRCSGRTGAR
jgi:hypothetical protein